MRKHLPQAGYRVQPRTGWQVRRVAVESEVNGVVLTRDGELKAPARIRRQMRRLRWCWHPQGGEATRAHLLGYEGHVSTVELES